MTTYNISFSGFTLRFQFPTPVVLHEELASFLSQEACAPDAEYEIRLLTEPLRPDGPMVFSQMGMQLYQTENGWLRIYTPLIEEDGCQVACFLRPDGKNILYYPAKKWDFYASPFHCIHLIGIETLLLQHDALLLHSSVVQYQGKVVLFSGPAFAGKSTQADLWAAHLGADILNGDRCVIRRYPDGFYGGGSPWCGTSGIYRRESAPLAGIFLVHQATENRVQRLGAAAFPPLFSQTVVNSWDSQFMRSITHLFEDLLRQVPVYRLDCRPNKEAALLACRTVFG